jgi:hypothetical protein
MEDDRFRRLLVDECIDRIKADWIGQIVSVGWRAPTEFEWNGKIIPEDRVPKWDLGTVSRHRITELLSRKRAGTW